MPNLSVSTPTLRYDAAATDVAVMEHPVEVRCPGAHFPGGGAFAPGHLGTAGLVMYRQTAPGPGRDIWDDDRQQWGPDPAALRADLKTLPLAFVSDTWTTLLVAAGRPGHPFEKATGQFPQYFFRAWFSAAGDAGPISGLSAPSAPVRFTGALDTLRAGLAVTPEQPTMATEVQMFLRNAVLQVVGSVLVRASADTAEVEIANWSPPGTLLSSVRLLASGEIRLKPGAGQRLTVEGPLEAEEITYRPSGGGAKITLPAVAAARPGS